MFGLQRFQGLKVQGFMGAVSTQPARERGGLGLGPLRLTLNPERSQVSVASGTSKHEFPNIPSVIRDLRLKVGAQGL